MLRRASIAALFIAFAIMAAPAMAQTTNGVIAGIVSDANSRKGWDKQENYSCRQGLLAPVPDPKYTVRAWRGVVTYLLRQQAFLYE